MIVAVITARGGSKRIPGKNIRQFAGRPMIAWPVSAAVESGVFDRVIVSTDSKEIASVAKKYGAEVPFMRPAELSDDHTPTAPVFEHALKMLEQGGDRVEYACCIYPTAPFIRAEVLREGLQILKETGAPAAVTVTSFDFPILRAFKKCADGSLAFNWPEHELARSQDLPEFYHDAGQLYWVRVADFLRHKKIIIPGSMPIRLERKYVQDLDTQEDWEAAELMAKVLLPGGENQ